MSNQYSNHLFERRDLGDGWYAIWYFGDRKWTLKKGGIDYMEGSLRQIEEYLVVRKEWRDESANQP